MKRIKGFLVIVLMMIVSLGAVVFSACQDDENMTISLSTNHVEIIIGENESSASLRAIVKDASDDSINIKYDSSDLQITTSYLGNGATQINVVAYRKCSNVEVTVEGLKKSAVFTVSATLPISSIEAKQSSYILEYSYQTGGILNLDSSLFNILPQETSQTDLNFSLSNSSQISGVSIQNNKLKLEPNLNTVPDEISVEVVSAYKDNVKTTIRVAVIKAIDVSLVKLCDESGRELEEGAAFNIARNNQTTSVLTLQVKVPYAVTNKELDVAPMFMYGDTGIRLNRSWSTKDDRNSCYMYTFELGLTSENGKTGLDKIWFVLNYKDYPTAKFSTKDKANGMVSVTTYDEITNISVNSNGTIVNVDNDLNIYTAYIVAGGQIAGMPLTIEAVPTTATSGKLSLNVDILDRNNNFLTIKNSSGSLVEFLNGSYLFDSGETFYFSVKQSGFEIGSGIDIQVLSEENPEIQKTLKFKFNESVTTLGFLNESGEDAYLETTRNYYLSTEGEFNSTTIKVALSPMSIDLRLAIVRSDNDIFEIGDITESGTFENTTVYSVPISAKNAGSGEFVLEFESGQKISANVIVVKELSDVSVKVEPTFNLASSVGDISYVDSSIYYIAVKNGQNIPLIFEGDSEILVSSFTFCDRIYDQNYDDLYNEESEYNTFDDVIPSEALFNNTSLVVSANYLRASKLIAPINVGKVWVKAVFLGKKVEKQEEGVENLLLDAIQEVNFLVEVYNPITSITLSTKNVELYAYDEVGEDNKSLTKQTVTIYLNKNGVAPTYNRIEIKGLTAKDGIYEYKEIGSDKVNLTIKSLSNNQFEFTALTRNDDGTSSTDGKFITASINFVARNLNIDRNIIVSQLLVSMKKPILVENIEITNVPESGIYLQTRDLTDNLDMLSFRILTKVTPLNALNKNVIYRFVPDNGTNSDIISISGDGLITIPQQNHFGGSGTVYIIPRDSVFVDENGHEYYRENYVHSQVRILVADGTTKERAIRISDLSEISDNSLHYMLMNDVVKSTAENVISGEFSGGLYGKSENSVKTNSITIFGGNSLFDVLSHDAIIEDLYLFGHVEDSGMLARTNKGTINNVTIDSYYTTGLNISKVVNTSGNAGGLCEINQGLISNCTFSGTVKGTQKVGGLVAINEGDIVSSCVLLYQVDRDNSEYMTIQGDLVGGIVGEFRGVATIKTSYIYNYANFELITGNNVGALVGNYNSTGAKIEQCFAEIGEFSEFYAVKNEDLTDVKEKTIIKNSYVLSRNGDEVYFNYYMTNQYSIVLSDEDTIQNFSNMIFGARQVWNISQTRNYGYPYLTNVTPVQALTSEDLENIKIVDSRLSLMEEDNNAVMYFYKVKDTITASEKSVIDNYNTISFIELFGITRTNGILVEIPSEYMNVLTVLGSNLQIKKTGVAKISISSKYDRSIMPIQKTITIIQYTSNFALSYSGQVLNAYSELGIHTHTNDTIQSSIQNTVVLVNRKLELEVPNYNIIFEKGGVISPYIIGNILGNHTILSDFEGDELKLDVYLKLDGQGEIINKIIKDNSTLDLTLKKVYGPISIQVSKTSAKIAPNDILSVEVYALFDSNYTEKEVTGKVLDSNNMPTNLIILSGLDVAQHDSYNQLPQTISYKYDLKISIDKNIKNFDPNGYTVVLGFKDNSTLFTYIHLDVLEQDVLKVTIDNYAMRDTNENSSMNVNYYPNNVLSPGTSGLLDIVVFPEYATYTHLTVTAESVNGKSISLIGMKKELNGGYIIDQTDSIPNFEFIEDGVKLYAKDFDQSEIGRYYVRAVVPSTVNINSVFIVIVKVYNGEELKYTQEYSLIIVPQEKAGITVNGESTTFAVVGQTIIADIIYEQTQELDEANIKVYKKDTDTRYEDYVTKKLIDGKVSYATKYYKSTLEIKIGNNENIDDFEVKVTTTRFVNGIEERVSSILVVYVIPFDLDMSTTHIINPDASNEIVGDRFFEHELDFDIGGIYTKSSADFISKGEEEFKDFVSKKWYRSTDGNFSINESNTRTWIYNLYYVNGNTTTPVVKQMPDGSDKQTTEDNSDSVIDYIEPQVRYVLDNDGVSYTTELTGKLVFRGKNNGTQRMVLSIAVKMPDGLTRIYNYPFTIKISDPTSDDAPDSISSAQEFLNAINGETEEDYILTNDLLLYDYEIPENTSKIRSLDGNGYQIIIFGFAQTENVEKNYALFKEVSSNTTLKNLLINIYYINVNGIDVSGATKVNFAPVAIINNGIITNTQVVSYKSNSKVVNDITSPISGINIVSNSTLDIEAKTAGFVLDNTGSITNSSVGGEYVDEYKILGTSSVTTKSFKLTPFVISAFGEISGFVNSNSGHIVSSYASNLRIVNNSNTDYTTITSGFVKNNSGYISMSYAKGAKQNNTEIHATLYGVETSGISAGFVYENSGEINNSYSNITLTNVGNNPGRNSAGFVYKNSGRILKSLSLSRIVGATTTQMNFAGVDDKGNYLNTGVIETSYYYDQVAYEDSTITIESAFGKGATVLNSVTDKEQYYGFSFSRSTNPNFVDGIWTMNSNGPDLVSPLIRSVSLRVASDLDQNLYTYVDEYGYGSINNPILIRTAEEFNRVFSGIDNSSSSKYIDVQNGYAFGNYRLINNIDLSELIDEMSNQDTYRLSSTRITLTGRYQDFTSGKSAGKFDGNGFTISGLALSDTNSTSVVTNFGMFKSIADNATVLNVNIVLGSTNSEGDIFGVEAKNVEYVGALAGTVKDSIIVNVSLKSLYENTNKVTVRGKNVVGGIIGRVIGDSYIYNLSAKDISVTAVMYPSNFVGTDYVSYNSYSRTSDSINTEMSYAGGIIGVIDYYVKNDINNYNFTEALHVTNGDATMLKVCGVSQISAGTVGGVIGYVGPLTTVQDALYELKKVEDHSMQGIYSYNGFAGGVVGVNKGFLRQIRSEHEYIWQIGEDNQKDDSIEDFIDDYYRASSSEERSGIDRGNEVLFQNSGYSPIGIGGLVGLEYSGKILKSYSKLNVINDYATYAGGIVGVNQGNNIAKNTNIDTAQNEDDIITTQNNNNFIIFAMEEVYASGDVRAKSNGGMTGGIFAYSNGESQKDRLVQFEKVNAINYWGDWIIDCQNIVYVIGNNGTDFSNSSEVACFKKDSIVFAGTPITNANYIEHDTNTGLQETTSLSEITGIGDDGVLFDTYFFGNNWDSESWLRDEDELYPHILFGYASRVIRIRHQDDFEKLRNSVAGTTYIIDPIEEYDLAVKDGGEPSWKQQIREETKEKWISITKQIIPIQNFKGTLRVADSKYTYKLLFHVAPTRPLFKSSLENSVFRDFIVEFDINLVSSTTSIFVEKAISTTFKNLSFSNVKLDATRAMSSDVGIVCGNAVGNSLFSNIHMNDCKVTVKANKNNAGLLFGNIDLEYGSRDISGIQSVVINDSSVVLQGISEAQDRTDLDNFHLSNVGLIGGKIFGNKEISIITDSKTDDKIGGVDETVDLGNQVILDGNMGYIQANIGNMVGYAKGIRFFGSVYAKLILQSKVTIKDSNIGAVVGEVDDCLFEGVKVQPQLYFEKVDDNSCIGGIVGKANNSEMQDCIVKNPDGKTSIVIDDFTGGSSAYPSFVGTIAGKYVDGQISRKTCLTQSFADMDITTQEAQAGQIFIGSGFGEINTDSSRQVSDVACYGNILSKTNCASGVTEGVKVYIGGFAGKANGNFKHIASTGEIANIVSFVNNEGTKLLYGKNINLYMSGLFAYVNNDISISESVSVGNIYPYAHAKIKYEITNNFKSNKVEIFEFKKSISVPTEELKFKKFTFGGIIACGEAGGGVNATVSKNNIISTLFNKNDRFIVTDANNYKVNILCGDCPADMPADGMNYYSHVYTLITNNKAPEASSIVQNIDYSTILGNINGTSGYWTSDDKDFLEKDLDLFNNSVFATGGKLNPKSVENNGVASLSTKFGARSTDYYMLSSDYNAITDQNSAFKLSNSIIVSNGQAIKLDDNSSVGPFESIDENSYVSGVVIYVKINGHGSNLGNTVFSAFVGENKGIIYSCNVRGTNNQKGIKITGKIENVRAKVSGFANINSGLIKECYTNIDVITAFTSTTEQAVYAGFVMKNNKGAVIESCYASGMIDNGEVGGNSATINLFAKEDEGITNNSYSIVKVAFIGTSADLLSVRVVNSFKQNDSNFVDKFASEVFVENTIQTKDYSLNYKGESDSTMKNMGQNLSRDIKFAYGYPTFIGGEYSNINYMHHATGSGTEDDPYQIPHLGKLQQIQSGTSTQNQHYCITYNSNGALISSDLKWGHGDNELNVSNIYLDSYDDGSGENCTIRNINIKTNGGIFSEIDSCHISNINLSNIIPQGTMAFVGLLANISKNSIIEYVKVTTGVYSHDLTYNLTAPTSGEYKDCIFFGGLVGGLFGGEISECDISEDTKTSGNTKFLMPIARKNAHKYIIGGLVAYTSDGNGATHSPKVTDVHISNSLTVGFRIDNGPNDWNSNTASGDYLFVVGGIIGLMQGNCEIEVASVRRSIDILTKSLDSNGNVADISDKNISTRLNINLYAGGIVGACGQTNDQYKVEKQEGKTHTISKCYVYEKCIIEAGNHYSCEETYVGGICGFGGSIDNCYNMAQSISSKAKYKVINDLYGWTFEGGASVKSKQSINGSTLSSIDYETIVRNSNVYVNKGAKWDSYTKLIFTQVEEKAHCAGIANDYQNVDKVINYCKNIKGGMKARQLHAYMETSTSDMQFTYIALDILLPILEAEEIAVAILALIAWTPWGAVAFGIALAAYIVGLTAANTMINEAVATVKVNQFNQILYDLIGGGDYYSGIPSQIKQGDSVFFGDAISWYVSVIPLKNDIFNYADGNKLPAGKIAYECNESSFVNELSTKLGYVSKTDNEWMGLTHKVIGDAHYLYTKQPILLANDIYFDAIGEKAGGGSSATCYSSINVYEQVTIDGLTRYSIHDSSDMYKTDGKIGKDSETNEIYNHFGILYSVHNDQDLPNTYSNVPTHEQGLGWGEDWIYNEQNGNWVTATSADVQTTKPEDMFAEEGEGDDKKSKIEIDESNNKITITINNTGDYNTTANILNKLPLCNSEAGNTIASIFNVLEGSDAYVKLETIQGILKNNGFVELKIEPIQKSGRADNTLDVLGRTLANSQQVSFNGSIQGRDSNVIIKIQLGKGSTGQFGLFEYSNNLTVNDLNIYYPIDVNDVSVDKEGCNFGGIVANNCGTFIVNNCQVEGGLKDYIEDEISSYSINVGGFVGKTSEDSITKITNSGIKYFKFDFKNTCNNAVIKKGIGGYIGQVDNGTLEVDISNSEAFVDIDSKSGNNIVGGFIGYINGCDNVKLNNVKLNSNPTNIVNVSKFNIGATSTIQNSDAICGGIVGFMKNSTLELNAITLFSLTDFQGGYNSNSAAIKQTQVIADSGANNVRVYAGGIAGYVDNSFFKLGENVIIGNKYFTNGETRTFIKAGLNSYPYATAASAGDIVGNNIRYTDIDIIDQGVTRKLTNDDYNVGQINPFDKENVKLHIYTKSLAFANPQYSIDQGVNGSSVLKPQGRPITSKQILVDVDSTTTKMKLFDSNTNDTHVEIKTTFKKAIKVDYFEYAPEVSTENIARVSHVNGESIALYNYQKVGYIIVTVAERLIDDTWWYKEDVYKLQIMGLMNTYGDYDLKNDVKLIHVVRNEYGSSNDIFGVYNPYMNSKYKNVYQTNSNGFKNGDSQYINFFENVGVYDIATKRDQKFLPSGSIYTQYTCRYESVWKDADKISHTEVEETEYRGGYYTINKEVSSIDIYQGYMRVLYDSTVIDSSSVTSLDDDEAIANVDGSNSRSIEGVYRKYYNIIADTQSSETKLLFNYEVYNTSSECIATGEYDVITPFDTIYQKMNTTTISSAKAINQSGMELVGLFTGNSKTTFSIKVDDSDAGITEEVDPSFLGTISDTYSLFNVSYNNDELNQLLPKVYQYKHHSVEGLGKNISIIIVSTMRIESNPLLYVYKDYVFANEKNEPDVVYYLGYIEYHLSASKISQENAKNRNKLFFPKNYSPGVLQRYDNHLKSLDQIQAINSQEEYASIIAYSIDVPKQTDYRLDFSMKKLIEREKVETYSFTLNSITFDGRSNANVSFDMDPEEFDENRGEWKTEEKYWSKLSIDITNNITDTYEILRIGSGISSIQGFDRYAVDYEISLNDAFCISHTIEGTSEDPRYQLYVPKYINEKMAGCYVFNISSNGTIQGEPTKYDNQGRVILDDGEQVNISGNLVVRYVKSFGTTTISYGYIELDGDRSIFTAKETLQIQGDWTPTYNSGSGYLQITKTDGTYYRLCLESDKFVVHSYQYHAMYKNDNGEDVEYDICESYISGKISITGDTGGINDIRIEGVYDFSQINRDGKPKYPVKKFDQASQQNIDNDDTNDGNGTYLRVYSNAESAQNGYMFNYDLTEILYCEDSEIIQSTSDSYAVRVYYYNSTEHANLFVSYNGDAYMVIKKDVACDEFPSVLTSVSIRKVGVVICVAMKFGTNEMMIDLTNGYRFTGISTEADIHKASSYFDTYSISYRIYNYYEMRKFVINSRFQIDIIASEGVDSQSIYINDLRPFNGSGNYAVEIYVKDEEVLKEILYYTLDGYEIEFESDSCVIDLTNEVSFGASARVDDEYKSCLIYNNATIKNGIEGLNGSIGTKIQECFYTRNKSFEPENLGNIPLSDTNYKCSPSGSNQEYDMTFERIVNKNENTFTDNVTVIIYDEEEGKDKPQEYTYVYRYSTDAVCQYMTATSAPVKSNTFSTSTSTSHDYVVLYNVSSEPDEYLIQRFYTIKGDREVKIDTVFGEMTIN